MQSSFTLVTLLVLGSICLSCVTAQPELQWTVEYPYCSCSDLQNCEGEANIVGLGDSKITFNATISGSTAMVQGVIESVKPGFFSLPFETKKETPFVYVEGDYEEHYYAGGVFVPQGTGDYSSYAGTLSFNAAVFPLPPSSTSSSSESEPKSDTSGGGNNQGMITVAFNGYTR